jgi:hypothetical protein
MRKNIITVIVVIVFIAINNFFWFGKYIDMSLTNDSVMWDLHSKSQSFNALKSICLEIDPNINKDHLIEFLKIRFPNDEVFEKHGNIYTSTLGFIFEGFKLKTVTDVVEFNENSKG